MFLSILTGVYTLLLPPRGLKHSVLNLSGRKFALRIINGAVGFFIILLINDFDVYFDDMKIYLYEIS